MRSKISALALTTTLCAGLAWAQCDPDLTPPEITCPDDTTVSCIDEATVATTGSATATDSCDVYGVPTSGLMLWLDASDVDADGLPDSIADGANISIWHDRSGANNDAEQFNESLKPSYESTGLAGAPALRFNGGERVQGIAKAAAEDGETLIMVFQPDPLTGARARIVNHPLMGYHLTLEPSGNWQVLEFSYPGSTPTSVASSPATGGVPVILTAREEAPDYRAELYLDGVLKSTGGPIDPAKSPWMLTLATADLSIGAAAADYYNGLIAEVIRYDRALSAAELKAVECYLAGKYSIVVGACGSNDPVIDFVDVSAPGPLADTTQITRTWSATDGSGNTATCNQSILAELFSCCQPDQIAPTVDCPPEVTVSCGAAPAETGEATATDFCAGAAGCSCSLPTDSLVLWLDGSDIDGNGEADALTTGSSVTTWADKSGQNNDATQATVPPSYDATGFFGQPAVRFDGIDDRLDGIDKAAAETGETLFMVMHPDTPLSGVRQRIWNHPGMGYRVSISPTGDWEIWEFSYPSGPASVASSPVTGLPTIVTARETGPGYASELYLDGALAATGPPIQAGKDPWYLTLGTTNVLFGSIGANPYKGVVAEVIRYDRALDAAEMDIVHCYISAKYGLNLDGCDCLPPVLTYSDSTAAGSVAQETIVTRTWTATDSCLNQSTCAQTIHRFDYTCADIETLTYNHICSLPVPSSMQQFLADVGAFLDGFLADFAACDDANCRQTIEAAIQALISP